MMHAGIHIGIVGLVTVFAGAGTPMAQSPHAPLDGPLEVTEDFKMTGADADSVASVGWSVGTAGLGANAFIVAGAFRDATFGPETGAAYVFRYDGTGWFEEQKLLASDAHANDSFGLSSAAYSGTEGEFVAVGAYKWPAFGIRGAVYAFRYDGATAEWAEEDRLTATDGEGGDGLGRSVSQSGNSLIAGAGGDDDLGEDAGAAYVFRRVDGASVGNTSWIEEAKLLASDGEANDAFGRAVGLTATSDGMPLAIVGPSNNIEPGNAAYVFVGIPDGEGGYVWEEEQKLVASDNEESDGLGWAVAIDETSRGTFALAGAPGVNGIGINSGAAYIFRRESDGQGGFEWMEEAKLMASDAAIGDVFGWSVSLAETPSGIVALVGTFHADDFRGAGYVFLRRHDGSWDEIARLVASDREPGDFFGYSAILGDDWAVMGAPLDDPMGGPAGRGAVYAYDIQRALASAIGLDPISNQQSMHVWPNPSSVHVFVRYSLDRQAPVELEVFDLLGRAVVRLDGLMRAGGEHTEVLNLAGIPAGRYFLRLTTPEQIHTTILTKAASTF